MTVQKNPDNGLPTNAPVVVKDWSAGAGQKVTKEWAGAEDDVDAKYEIQKSLALAGNGTEQITFRSSKGRATLVARLTRTGSGIPGYAYDITVIEELYAVDIIKDICEAPYFAVTVDVPKGLPLFDDEVAYVRLCVENRFTEAEITTYAQENGLAAANEWANWNTGMKELRYHMLRGVESFFETGFVFRRSEYGVRTSQIKAVFDDINTVVAAPSFDSDMDALIDALPDGEWLYKPPQAEHLGRGKWRVGREWHWAEKWSIVYGGTWNGP